MYIYEPVCSRLGQTWDWWYLVFAVLAVDDVVIGGLDLMLGIIVQLFGIAVQERVLLVLYPKAIAAVLLCVLLLLCKVVAYSIISTGMYMRLA